MTLELSLTPFQKRLAALALAIVPLGMVVLAAASSASQLLDRHDQVALLKQERANYASLIAHAPEWRRGIAAFQSASAGGELFFIGNSSAAPGPQLEVALSSIVTKNGGTVRQATSDTGATGALHATVTFEASISDLTKILHAVRDARPLILTKRLIVRRPDIASSTVGPTRLDVELATTGYAQTP